MLALGGEQQMLKAAGAREPRCGIIAAEARCYYAGVEEQPRVLSAFGECALHRLPCVGVTPCGGLRPRDGVVRKNVSTILQLARGKTQCHVGLLAARGEEQ